MRNDPAMTSISRRPWLAAIAVMAAILTAGCATVAKYDAASDVHAFLISVRDGDRDTFEAHVDRPALKDNLKARLLEMSARRYGTDSKQTLGALLLAGPLASLTVDGLVRPQVFAAAAALMGYGAQTSIPNPILIGRQVKPLGGDRVCVMGKTQCLFIFKREEGTWRMIAYEGDLGLLGRGVEGLRGLL